MLSLRSFTLYHLAFLANFGSRQVLIPAVFADTGLELPQVRDFVKTVPNVVWRRPETPFSKVIEDYGYPVVSKEVAHRIYYARKGSPWAHMHLRGLTKDGTPSKFNERYKKWAFLVDAPFPVSGKCCDITKKRPLHRYQKETGAAIITGTMACESIARQSAYLQTGCNSFHSAKSQPMSFWLEQDVLMARTSRRQNSSAAKRSDCNI